MKNVSYDGVIYNWYGSGGVGRYFEEIYFGSKLRGVSSCMYLFDSKATAKFPDAKRQQPRVLERYRDFLPDKTLEGIFHSSYYRLPDRRVRAKYLTVTTVHDFIYEKLLSGVRKSVHSWQKFRSIREADAVICVSHSTKSDLEYYLPEIDQEKVYVVHNGVSKDFSSTTFARPINNHVLFVGERRGYKNFGLAVKAVANCANLRLQCVGGGPLRREELELLNKLLPGRFGACAQVTNIELKALYQRSYALIYPSLYEGFGLPPLEAIRCGCPVVALRTSSIPEVIGNAGLLSETTSTDEFTELLMSLASNDLRKVLFDAGIAQSETFDWNRSVDQTLKVYERLSN